jgi:hypothetical protein
MTSVPPRGKVLFLLLAVLLAFPWSLAAAPRRQAHRGAEAQTPAPVFHLAGWLESLLTSLWGEAGLNIDPNGVADVPPPPGSGNSSEAGFNIDPDGRGGAKAGLDIDPDGFTTVPPPPSPGERSEEGANIDPNGR